MYPALDSTRARGPSVGRRGSLAAGVAPRRWGFARRIAVFATALRCASPTIAAAQASPAWVVREAEPAFALRAPEGFLRRPTERVAYALFVHPGRRAVFGVFELGEELAQGQPFGPSARARIAEADPIPFNDRDVTFRVQGFDVPGVRGAAVDRGVPVVRFAVAIPARGGTPTVALYGPLDRERELRATLEGVLSTARTRTDWRTPAQARVASLSARALAFALGASLLYAVLWLALWRGAREAREAPSWPRVLLRGALALGWALSSPWWITRAGWRLRGMGVLLLALAIQQGLRALALWRRRREPSGEDAPEPSPPRDVVHP
jgi:hypothetical protein